MVGIMEDSKTQPTRMRRSSHKTLRNGVGCFAFVSNFDLPCLAIAMPSKKQNIIDSHTWAK